MHPRDFASLDAHAALTRLGSSPDGLRDDEARARLRATGRNALLRPSAPGPLLRFLRQFRSPLILLLFIAAAVMSIVGDIKDSLVILFVLVFNATVGFIQEGRASRALAALERTIVQKSVARRGGRTASIPTSEIVPGDIIILNEGDVVPADGRLIESIGLRMDESMLTGESVPVSKTDRSLPATDATPLGDLRNAAFRQTHVVAGHGALLVTTTGSSTEVGRIASAIGRDETEPPLAKKIKYLGRAIALITVLFSCSLFFFGLLAGRPAPLLFATVVTLAVSIIPEGLPVVLTLVLARGVSRMAAKHAVVKRLNAVEGLGQVQVICTDKTGTLTKNELVVRDTDVRGERLARLAEAAAAFVGSTSDPVDTALAAFTAEQRASLSGWTKLDERPFSYEEKRRFAMYRAPDGRVVSFIAGSPERVYAMCEANGDRASAEGALQRFAAQGLRVIAFARREGDLAFDARETPWQCTGCVAMGDELRPEAVKSIAWCREQGIRVVMVTGDHPDTALAIARKAGIATDPREVLNGDAFEKISDEALSARLDEIRVFSRISPQHKIRIVMAYRAKGLLTAMTGDGVNDAPALQAADIGVAMGKGGTEVAREAADLVLLDDNFATIVTAVQEGRAVIGNVRKVVTYLFSTSIAEAVVLTVTLLGNLPLPLLPVQIIWLNLVTDGFLDVSLAMEPTHHGRRLTSGAIVDRASVSRMLLLGSVMAGGTLLVYATSLDRTEPELRTLTLLTLAVFQWFNAWSARSESTSIFRLSPFSNPYLVSATFAVFLLQFGALYGPYASLLRTVPLPASDWLLAAGVSTAVIAADEVWKRRTRHARATR